MSWWNNDNSFILAAKKSDLDQFKTLLDNGADINARDKYKNTALMYAAYQDNVVIVGLLLNRANIDVNAQNSIGDTALILASAKLNYNITEMLLAKIDLNVNIQNNKGDTALIAASLRLDYSMFKLLLSREDTNVNIQNKDGNTAIIVASISTYNFKLKEDITWHDYQPETEYVSIIYPMYTKIVQDLCSREKVDLYITNNERETAYDIAVKTSTLFNDIPQNTIKYAMTEKDMEKLITRR